MKAIGEVGSTIPIKNHKTTTNTATTKVKKAPIKKITFLTLRPSHAEHWLMFPLCHVEIGLPQYRIYQFVH